MNDLDFRTEIITAEIGTEHEEFIRAQLQEVYKSGQLAGLEEALEIFTDIELYDKAVDDVDAAIRAYIETIRKEEK